MGEALTWKEIEAQYSGEWVELIDYDWPTGEQDPVRGVVRVHAKTRQEFYELAKVNAPAASAIIFVGKPDRRPGTVLCSSLMKIEHVKV